MSVPSNPTDGARERWEHLLANPGEALRWDWFALLRLLQAGHPDLPRLGYSIEPDEDPARFGAPPYFHAPATTIAAVRRGFAWAERPPSQVAAGGTPDPVWIHSYHLGLFGPFGPLPLHLTEVAYRCLRAHEGALAGFGDVLHHRFLTLFFRAWADARKEVALDRPPAEAGDELESDPWSGYLGAFIGLGLPSLRHRGAVPDHARFFYSGRLVQGTRNADGLRAILGDYFAVPVEIVEFVAGTVRVPEEVRWKLGAGGGSGLLGLTTIAGDRVEDPQIGFRIRLGPLTGEELGRFLPGNEGHRQLQDWVRLYTGRETDSDASSGLASAWDLQLQVRADEVPPMILGRELQLGWTTWLPDSPTGRESGPSALRPEELLDPEALVVRLQRGGTPVARHVADRLSAETRRLLSKPNAGEAAALALRDRVLGDLNLLIAGPPLFDTEGFASVSLRESTLRLLRTRPAGRDRARLNRLLLQEAFPDEIARVSDPDDVVLHPS